MSKFPRNQQLWRREPIFIVLDIPYLSSHSKMDEFRFLEMGDMILLDAVQLP